MIRLSLALYLLFFNFNKVHTFTFTSRYIINYRYIQMDDEIPRNTAKIDLTTKDEYLSSRFIKLSSSGYDLTPLESHEINNWIKASSNQVYFNIFNSNNTKNFLGFQEKGIYVNNIGGLPLFSSGFRIDEMCNSTTLYFHKPCDEEHIYLNHDDVYCVRSNVCIGRRLYHSNDYIYCILVKYLQFFSLDQVWPISSQPDNVWGTEGQFTSWNNNQRSKNPLSY